MNIYISPDNEAELRQWASEEPERTMSGLVNSLLSTFLFKGESTMTQYKDGQPERKAIFTQAATQPSEPYTLHKSPAMGPSIPPNMERGCCLNAKPCQHWVWNGDEQVYINSLSGRKKEV